MGAVLVQALAVDRGLGTNGHGKEEAEDGGEADHLDVDLEEDGDRLVRSGVEERRGRV